MPRARRLRPLNMRNTVGDMIPEDAEAIQPPPMEPEHIPANEVFETPIEPEREVLVPVDPLYQRQHSLGLHTPSVALIGCGGVGCWVALSLILGGVTELTLFDGDTLSVHNLNRFPLPEGSIGELKSVALARWLRTLRPKAEISARGEFDPAIHNPDTQWVVCATDSLKSRRMCYRYANLDRVRAKYLEVGADGERWGLSPSPPEFSTELEQEAGYQTVPVHVGPCMMAGAAAAYYVLHDATPKASHSGVWLDTIGEFALRTMSEVEVPEIVCSCREAENGEPIWDPECPIHSENPFDSHPEMDEEVDSNLDREWTQGNQEAADDEYVTSHPNDYTAQTVLEAADRINRRRNGQA